MQSCGSEEGAHTFTPHSFQVSCMHFSPCNPAHLLSLSNESLRCADVTRGVFDEVRRCWEGLFCLVVLLTRKFRFCFHKDVSVDL